VVSQEDGPDQLNVELPGGDCDESCVLRRVPLADLVALFEHAAKKLTRD
jgi:hypothetical protein